MRILNTMNFSTDYMYYSVNNPFNDVSQEEGATQNQDPQFMFFDQCYMPYATITKVENQPDRPTTSLMRYPLFDDTYHLTLEDLCSSNNTDILVSDTQFSSVINDNPSQYSSGSSDFYTSPDNKALLQSSVTETLSNPSSKPKRKRISTVAQRRAANIR